MQDFSFLNDAMPDEPNTAGSASPSLNSLRDLVPDNPPTITCRVERVRGDLVQSSVDRIGGVSVTQIEPLRYFDFGLLDKKGRRIGMQVYGESTTYTYPDTRGTSGPHHRRMFTITRNGELTTWTDSPLFSSWEEAEADVNRHVAASLKRYAKTCRRA